MSTRVVDYIRYGDTTGYAKSHTTTEVPDMTDVNKKADKLAVDNQIYNINNLIKQEISNRQSEDGKLAKDLNTVKLDLNSKASKDELKNILSATSLERIKEDITTLYKQHIVLVQEEVRKSQEKYQKDIVAFEKAANKANSELESKFVPINSNISAFNDKIESLVKCIGRIGDIDDKISELNRQIRQAQENVQRIVKDIVDDAESKTTGINERLLKVQEETNNVVQKVIGDVELKVSNVNQQIREIQEQAKMYVGELKNLRENLEIVVAVECEQKVNNLLLDKFEIFREQLLKEIEEREKNKKGFWTRIFSKKS